MKEYAPKEVQRHLPKAYLIHVRILWSWFKRPTQYQQFMKSRVANALTVWLGPLEITIRRPWYLRSAAQLHPESFIKAGKEDLL